MSEYTMQARKFLLENNIRFSFSEPTLEYPDWDKECPHFMFKCRFFNRNTSKSMTVKFYSSRQDYYNNKQTMDAYDVLACLTKYEVGTLENFISDYEYEIKSYEDYKKVEKTFKACKREYKNVLRVFGDCLDELCEIS